MTRRITKAQAREIIFREIQVNITMLAIIAIATAFASITLAVAIIAGAIACSMRAYLLVDGRSGAEVRIPSTALAISFPWFFVLISGEQLMHINLPLFVLLTFGSAIYFGMIRKDNPIHTTMLKDN